MALTKEQILSAQDLKSERVEVPEWGGEVYVRVLSAEEALAFHAAGEAGGSDDAYARLLVMSVTDESGCRLFTDADVAALKGKSHVATMRVVEAATKVNGFAKDQGEELKNG